jgi:hypothetical protein
LKVPLKEQLKSVRRVARYRGYRIKADRRLGNTPYAAMHPRAAKEMNRHLPRGQRIPYRDRTITYDPDCHRLPRKRVVDLRHELIEEHRMDEHGLSYKPAHKIANKLQRTVGAEVELLE